MVGSGAWRCRSSAEGEGRRCPTTRAKRGAAAVMFQASRVITIPHAGEYVVRVVRVAQVVLVVVVHQMCRLAIVEGAARARRRAAVFDVTDP